MMMMRRFVRWRTLALTLLGVILALNFIIFITLPSNRQNEVYSEEDGAGRQRYDSRGISHLQFPRKRLNKSNFTSDSLGADGGAVGGGGAAWEEGVGDHPPLLLQGQGGRFDPKTVDAPRKQAEDQRQQQQQEEEQQEERAKSVDDRKRNREGSAVSRGNFTDPVVDAFLDRLVRKGLLDVLPGVGLQENYWAFLKRQRRRRKSGIQLPAFRNYKS